MWKVKGQWRAAGCYYTSRGRTHPPGSSPSPRHHCPAGASSGRSGGPGHGPCGETAVPWVRSEAAFPGQHGVAAHFWGPVINSLEIPPGSPQNLNAVRVAWPSGMAELPEGNWHQHSKTATQHPPQRTCPLAKHRDLPPEVTRDASALAPLHWTRWKLSCAASIQDGRALLATAELRIPQIHSLPAVWKRDQDSGTAPNWIFLPVQAQLSDTRHSYPRFGGI